MDENMQAKRASTPLGRDTDATFTPIDDALSHLETAHAELDRLLQQLVDRIAPVLSPEPGDTEDDGMTKVDPERHSALVEAVVAQTRYVFAQNRRLMAIIQRIEV